MGDKSIKGRSPITLTKGQRLLSRGIVQNQKAVKVEEHNELEKQEPQPKLPTKKVSLKSFHLQPFSAPFTNLAHSI